MFFLCVNNAVIEKSVYLYRMLKN